LRSTPSLAKHPLGAGRAVTRPSHTGTPPCDEVRFRQLLTEEVWTGLSPATRRRFSKRIANGLIAVYVGEVTAFWTSRLGWWLTQVARVVGAPLPLHAKPSTASTVTVSEHDPTGGQIWTRLYARSSGPPQRIRSVKRFAGPTGLEEYLGRGLGIALTIHVESSVLVFRSANYFVQIFGRRLRLPRWIAPGDLTVTHADAGDDAFAFELEISRRHSGPLVRLSAIFREVQP